LKQVQYGFHFGPSSLEAEEYRLVDEQPDHVLATFEECVAEHLKNEGDYQDASRLANSSQGDHPCASTPHQTANPDVAAALNIAYIEQMMRWKAMSWFQRLITRRPQPPTGT
jgi:hypothetical protein